jgi:hypothetical protein
MKNLFIKPKLSATEAIKKVLQIIITFLDNFGHAKIDGTKPVIIFISKYLSINGLLISECPNNKNGSS